MSSIRLINNNTSLFFIWMLLVTNCISPVDFQVENQSGRLVITGQVSSLQERTKIQIGLTQEFRVPIPVSGAYVQIQDSNGNNYVMNEISEGTYTSSLVAIPGVSYRTHVEAPNRKIYESEWEKTPEYSSQVEVTYEFATESYINAQGATIENNFVNLYASTIFPAEWKERLISWEVEEVYIKSPTDFPDPFGRVPDPCFITQKAEPNRIALFDGSNSNSNILSSKIVCSRLVDHTFLERHYFNTYQSSITKEAYTYWSQIDVVANQTGSIFDTPPARVKGNLKNITNSDEEVFGYFQASNETYNRFFLVPGYFPYQLFYAETDCTFRGWGVKYVDFCLDCLKLRNSSLIMPYWFGE